MPYDIVKKDGKHCVVKKDDGKVMGCHDTDDQAKAQMAAIHANEGKSMKIPLAVVEKLCPSCAAEMRSHHITAISIDEIRALPQAVRAGFSQGLCDAVGGGADPGFFTNCMQMDFEGVDDQESFCAALHQWCTGIWPAEHERQSYGGGEEAERRAYDAELRFVGPTEGKVGVGLLSGYAAVFGALSLEMGSTAKRFRERIAPGAFRGALESGGNTLAFYHHGAAEGGPAMPLGSTRDGSLRLREDGHGLAFDLDLPDTTVARDLAELVRRGTVRGVSFAFPSRAVRDTWQNEGGTLLRTLHEIRTLIDVSPTHLPAYPDTALAVRSLERWEEERRTLSAGGEVSHEARQRALEAAFRALLGDPWAPGATYWMIRATFDASVVVERSGKLLSYPVAWKGPDPALGEPSPVQEVIQPVPAGAEARRRRRLRLAEVGLTGGDEAA